MKSLLATALALSSAALSLAADPAPARSTLYQRLFDPARTTSDRAIVLSNAMKATKDLKILTGNFRVTAATKQRAVLRRIDNASDRFVVDFFTRTPVEGEKITLTAAQNVRVVEIRRGGEGQRTVYASEPKDQQ